MAEQYEVELQSFRDMVADLISAKVPLKDLVETSGTPAQRFLRAVAAAPQRLDAYTPGEVSHVEWVLSTLTRAAIEDHTRTVWSDDPVPLVPDTKNAQVTANTHRVAGNKWKPSVETQATAFDEAFGSGIRNDIVWGQLVGGKIPAILEGSWDKKGFTVSTFRTLVADAHDVVSKSKFALLLASRAVVVSDVSLVASRTILLRRSANKGVVPEVAWQKLLAPDRLLGGTAAFHTSTRIRDAIDDFVVEQFGVNAETVKDAAETLALLRPGKGHNTKIIRVRTMMLEQFEAEDWAGFAVTLEKNFTAYVKGADRNPAVERFVEQPPASTDVGITFG